MRGGACGARDPRAEFAPLDMTVQPSLHAVPVTDFPKNVPTHALAGCETREALLKRRRLMEERP